MIFKNDPILYDLLRSTRTALTCTKGSFVFLTLVASIILLGITTDSYAQDDSIITSAAEHNNKFFGEAILQVIITDKSSTNDNLNDNIAIKIDAQPDSGGA